MTDPLSRLDRPGLDTWLARALHARAMLELPVLQELVAEARQVRAQHVPTTLAQTIAERRLLPVDVLEEVLASLEQREALPSAPADSPADQVGDYRILERIGAGGMGTVHLAEHVKTGARYAVKTLPAFGDPEFAARFRREGEAQARVDRHPNVVGVHALGQDRGRLYLVLDLVQGSDLDARLKAGALPYHEAAALVRDLARGLAHVHAQGVLHRDIKPANVLIDETGTAKLVDFGLAKVADAGDLTQTGTILGTPSYMAPEQVKGLRDAIDERTDVYGLGALLYHCLTGQPPFKGESALGIMSQVARDQPPPVRNLNPNVPASLEVICHRALSKTPSERQTSASALADELDSLLSTTSPSDHRRRLGLVAMVLIPLTALTLLAVVLGTGSPRQAAPSPRPTSNPAPPAPAPGERELPEIEGEPWPLILDREAPEIVRALESYSNYERSKDLDDLRSAASLGLPRAQRKLGILHLLPMKRSPEPRHPGLGLQLLRLAVRHEDPHAAYHLALSRGAPSGLEFVRTDGRKAARALGLDEDLVLAGALLRVAEEGADDTELDIRAATAAFVAAGHALPSRERAWRIIQNAYMPPAVARALRRGEEVLDAMEDRLSPTRKIELVERTAERSPFDQYDYAMGLGKRELPARVFLLRRAARQGSGRSKLRLARWLAEGEEVPSERLEPVTLAGLWRLFQLAEAGSDGARLRARLDLAWIYAFPPKDPSIAKNLEVASAWDFLGADYVQSARIADDLQRRLGEDLPTAPATPRMAWLAVRKVLPWVRGEQPLAASDIPPWPLSWGDAAHRRKADAHWQIFAKAKRNHAVDEGACQALRQAGRMDRPRALRELGQLHLFGQHRELVAHRPGLGVYFLQRALRFGDPEAALDLAVLHGAAPDSDLGRLQGYGTRSRRLAIPQDERLAAALTRIADQRRGLQETTRRLLDDLEQVRGITAPQLRKAWRIVQEFYEPASITRALIEGEQALDALERQVDPARRERLLAARRPDSFVLAANEALNAEDVPGAVFLLRYDVRDNGSPNAERELAKLLISDAVESEQARRRAGLWRLWQLTLQGDFRAMRDMAYVYANATKSYAEAVTRDLAVAGAYCYLAKRYGGGEMAPDQRLWFKNMSGELPPVPANESEAWRLVRAALPWSKGRGK